MLILTHNVWGGGLGLSVNEPNKHKIMRGSSHLQEFDINLNFVQFWFLHTSYLMVKYNTVSMKM